MTLRVVLDLSPDSATGDLYKTGDSQRSTGVSEHSSQSMYSFVFMADGYGQSPEVTAATTLKRYHKLLVHGTPPPFPLATTSEHEQSWLALWRQMEYLHLKYKIYDWIFIILGMASILAVVGVANFLVVWWIMIGTVSFVGIATLLGTTCLFLTVFIGYSLAKQSLATERNALCEQHERDWLLNLANHGVALECDYETTSFMEYLYLYLYPVPSSDLGIKLVTTENDTEWIQHRHNYIRIETFNSQGWRGIWTPVRIVRLSTVELKNQTIAASRLENGPDDDLHATWMAFWKDRCDMAHERLLTFRVWVVISWIYLIWLIVTTSVWDWDVLWSVLVFVGVAVVGATCWTRVQRQRPQYIQQQLDRTKHQDALTRAGFYWETRHGRCFSWRGFHSVEWLYLFPPSTASVLDCTMRQ